MMKAQPEYQGSSSCVLLIDSACAAVIRRPHAISPVVPSWTHQEADVRFLGDPSNFSDRDPHPDLEDLEALFRNIGTSYLSWPDVEDVPWIHARFIHELSGVLGLRPESNASHPTASFHSRQTGRPTNTLHSTQTTSRSRKRSGEERTTQPGASRKKRKIDHDVLHEPPTLADLVFRYTPGDPLPDFVVESRKRLWRSQLWLRK